MRASVLRCTLYLCIEITNSVVRHARKKNVIIFLFIILLFTMGFFCCETGELFLLFFSPLIASSSSYTQIPKSTTLVTNLDDFGLSKFLHDFPKRAPCFSECPIMVFQEGHDVLQGWLGVFPTVLPYLSTSGMICPMVGHGYKAKSVILLTNITDFGSQYH